MAFCFLTMVAVGIYLHANDLSFRHEMNGGRGTGKTQGIMNSYVAFFSAAFMGSFWLYFEYCEWKDKMQRKKRG